MIGYLRAPNIDTTSFREREKLRLSWQISLLVFISFSFLAVFHFITDDINKFSSLVSLGAISTLIITLKVTKSYRLGAIIICVAGTLASQYDIFTVVNTQKIANVAWLIALGLFVFYTLGTKAGMLVTIINLGGLALSHILTPNEVLQEAIRTRGDTDNMNLVVNMSVATSIVMYLIWKMIRTAETAERMSMEAQQNLEKQNAVISAQNEEKTVMLREIHHRVKNNLQVITSLLRLQSREIRDVATAEHFREAINRVLAMALIHDKLYQSDDLSKVDIKGYLQDLANDLILSYSTEIPVEVTVQSNVEHLVPKSLVSVGLLFNELISNSLKHGFKNNDNGLIHIEIYTPDDQSIEMVYTDNGTWKQPSHEESFGLELIDTLTSQLVGKFERTIDAGTRYHFIFEIEK